MFCGTTQRVGNYLTWVRLAESSITCLSIYAEFYIFHAALKYLLSSSCVVKVQVSSCFSKTTSLDTDFKQNLGQSGLTVLSAKCSSDKWNLRALLICLSSGVCHPCGISFCTPSCCVSQWWTLDFTFYWAKVTSCDFFLWNPSLLTGIPKFLNIWGSKDAALWIILNH